MRIKNAFRLIVSNFKLIYKSAFARFCCTAIFLFIGYFLVYEQLKPLIDHQTTKDLLRATRDLFVKFFAGEGINTEQLPDAFDAFMKMLSQNSKEIAVATSEFVIVVLLLRIFINVFEYGFAKVINGYMSARSRYGVLTTLLLDFGRAIAFSSLSVVINFIIEVAIYIITISILISFLPLISIFAIFLAILFLTTALAFKFSITSSFLPNIVVDNTPVIKALANTAPKNYTHFASLFGSYFFLILITFYVNVTFAVSTFFMGLTISLPITGLFFTTLSLVDKYHIDNKLFYTDGDHVEGKRDVQTDDSVTVLMD